MRFEADPQSVTDILGIEPTSVARKGELSRSGRLRETSGWWLETHPDRLIDGAAHAAGLSRILDQIRGRESRFARLQSEIAPGEVGIYGGLYVPANGQCGVWLDASDMSLLAYCGIGWGLDLFAQD